MKRLLVSVAAALLAWTCVAAAARRRGEALVIAKEEWGDSDVEIHTPLTPLLPCPSSICSSNGTFHGLCLLNQSYVVPSGCLLQGNGTLVLAQSVTLQCKTPQCQLTIRMGGDVTLHTGSSVLASTIEVAAGGNVHVAASASLTTSGNGLQSGPGAGVHGNGGGHAGAGGRLPCSIVSAPCCQTGGAYYLGPDLGNAVNPLLYWDEEWGSGGGVSGAKGGGRINISVAGTLTVDSPGFIASDGAPTLSSDGGSGAGGVVVVHAHTLNGTGAISADGGPGSYSKALTAGGGGRVAVVVQQLDLDSAQITAVGGQAGQSQEQAQCLNGGAGTVFLAYTSPATNSSVAIPHRSINIANSRDQVNTYGMTALNVSLDANVSAVSITNGAVVAIGSVQMHNNSAGLAMAGAVIGPLNDDLMYIHSPVVSIDGQFAADVTPVHLSVNSLTVSSSSVVSFDTMLSVSANESVMIAGTISQTTVAERADPNLRLVRGSIPLLGGVLAVNSRQSVVIAGTASMSADIVNLYGSSLQVHGIVQSTRYSCADAIDHRRHCYEMVWDGGFFPPLSNYSLVLNGAEMLIAQGAHASGSVILLCSQTIQVDGKVSANGHGCASGDGPGHGQPGPSEGGGGGHGGAGGASAQGAGGGSTYGRADDPALVGSGGGGTSITGGAGGGVVVLQSLNLALSGNVSADGAPASAGSQAGGGSGGSVSVHTQCFPAGTGSFSANGGAGQGGGGGGGGGRMLFAILGAQLADGLAGLSSGDAASVSSVATADAAASSVGTTAAAGPHPSTLQRSRCGNSTLFSGQGTVDGGTASLSGKGGHNGSIKSYSCKAGYGGMFCHPCAPGFFKNSTGNRACVPCYNKPVMSVYVSYGSDSANCPFVCKQGYNKPKCLSPFQAFIDAVGGYFGFVACVAGVLLLTGGASLAVYWRRKRKQHVMFKQALLQDRTERRSYNTTRNADPRNLTEAGARLRRGDLPTMVHRIYFSGSNTSSNPWRLSPIPPKQLMPFVDMQTYEAFTVSVNELASWPRCCTWERAVLMLLRVVSFPLSRLFLQSRRKLRCDRLRHFTMQDAHVFLKSVRAREWNDMLRFGTSADLTLGYIDVLHEEWVRGQQGRQLQQAVGMPRLPLMVALSGTGTFFSPFYLDTSDVLLQSVTLLPDLTRFIATEWQTFVAKFNNCARLVSRDKVERTAGPLVALLEEYNRDPAKLGGITVGLHRMWPDVVLPEQAEDAALYDTSALLAVPTATPGALSSLGQHHSTRDSGFRSRGSRPPSSRTGKRQVYMHDEVAQLAILITWSPEHRRQRTRSVRSGTRTVRAASTASGTALAERERTSSARLSGTFSITRSRDAASMPRLDAQPTRAEHPSTRSTATGGVNPTTSSEEQLSRSQGSRGRGPHVLAEETDALRRYGLARTSSFDSDAAQSNAISDVESHDGSMMSPGGSVPSWRNRALMEQGLESQAGVAQSSRLGAKLGAPGPRDWTFRHRHSGLGVEEGGGRGGIHPRRVVNGHSQLLDVTTPYPSAAINEDDVAAAAGCCPHGFCDMLWWYLVRIMFRTEQKARLPYGVALGIMAVLVIGDLAASGVMMLELFCIQDTDPATIDQYANAGPKCVHIGFYCMLLLPPFAIVAAPTWGLFAVASQTASAVRSFATWNALAIVPAVVGVALSLIYHGDLPSFVLFVGPPYVAAKVVVAQIVPQLISQPETARRRRGWLGARDADGDADAAHRASPVPRARDPMLGSIVAAATAPSPITNRRDIGRARRRGDTDDSGHHAYEPLTPSPAVGGRLFSRSP